MKSGLSDIVHRSLQLNGLSADFIGLLYPLLCPVCGRNLAKNEQLLCSYCKADIPLADNQDLFNNKTAELFWGRISLKYAFSFYHFKRDSHFRQLVYRVKYQGDYRLGVELGRWFGMTLKERLPADIDLLHPVPLHIKKLRKRGFNQGEAIAKGLHEILCIPLVTNALERKTPSETQTRRGRFDRWQNVEGIFKVVHPELLKGKHVMLVDDVITTGATIEACCQPLLTLEGVTLSVASLAIATPE